MRFDLSRPWAIEPAYARQCFPMVLDKMASGELDDGPQPYLLTSDGAKHAIDAGNGKKGMIAVVPLSGPLSPQGEYGGTSTDVFRRTVAALDRRADVAGIVVDITSPGGMVTGTMEAADALREVRERGQTRTTSVANGMMASAATWIGTTAERVIVTPSGEAGSIGVISIYTDYSEAYSEMGVKFEIARTPEQKARFTGVEPMDDDMREEMIDANNAAYSQFVSAMARNRGIAAAEVEGRFGGGRMLSAQKAVDSGLVDGIGTLENAIAELASGIRGRSAQAFAAAGRKLQLQIVGGS